MITLQINDNGSWRTLLKIAPERRDEILRAAANLAGVLGSRTKWCLLHADGQREWLHDIGERFRQWHPITAEEPAPLVDVLVSVYTEGDAEPEVLMAYRKQAGGDLFYLTGTDDQVIRGAYAFSEVIAPAQRVAA